MSIAKLNSQAKVTEVDSAGKQILTALEKIDWATDPYMPAIIAELTAVSNEMTTAIKSTKAESTLDEKDGIRDEKVRGLFYMLTGFQYHPSQAVKDAAEKALAVFNKYGVAIVSENYASESSLINSMLNDFAEPSIAEAIAKLPGFAQLVEELKTAQAEFETADQEWNQAKTGTSKSATEIKRDLLAVINTKLVTALRLGSLMDSAKFGAITAEIDGFITTANRTVKRR